MGKERRLGRDDGRGALGQKCWSPWLYVPSLMTIVKPDDFGRAWCEFELVERVRLDSPTWLDSFFVILTASFTFEPLRDTIDMLPADIAQCYFTDD